MVFAEPQPSISSAPLPSDPTAVLGPNELILLAAVVLALVGRTIVPTLGFVTMVSFRATTYLVGRALGVIGDKIVELCIILGLLWMARLPVLEVATRFLLELYHR